MDSRETKLDSLPDLSNPEGRENDLSDSDNEDADALQDKIESYFDGAGGINLPIVKPTSWEECFDINSVDEEFRDRVRNLLSKYPLAYSKHALDIGCIKDPSLALTIEVTEIPPKGKIYPIPPPLVKPTRDIINELLEVGIIKEGTGPTSTPTFLVPKNSQQSHRMKELKAKGEFTADKIEYRYICDYRNTNKFIIEKVAGASSISHVYNTIRGKRFFCLLDIKSAFFQVPVAEDSQFLTQITLDNGLGSYWFRRMPMGLRSSPAGLQWVMTRILNPRYPNPNGQGFITKPLYTDNLVFYVDDVLAVASDADEMDKVLHAFFQRLEEMGFKISLNKAEFFVKDKKVELLGFEVDKDGISITPKKLDIAKNMERPKTTKQLQAFLGFSTIYQDMSKTTRLWFVI